MYINAQLLINRLKQGLSPPSTRKRNFQLLWGCRRKRCKSEWTPFSVLKKIHTNAMFRNERLITFFHILRLARIINLLLKKSPVQRWLHSENFTPCSLVEFSRRFSGFRCHHHQGDECHDGDRKYLWNLTYTKLQGETFQNRVAFVLCHRENPRYRQPSISTRQSNHYDGVQSVICCYQTNFISVRLSVMKVVDHITQKEKD